MSRAVRWSIAMTAFGLVTAVVVLALTGSWWWTVTGLVGAGIVGNAAASNRAWARTSRRNPR